MQTHDSGEFRLTHTTKRDNFPNLPTNKEPWVIDAKCGSLDAYAVDEIFFVEKGDNYSDAREFCRGCPVRRECAEYALTLPYELDGYWGGTTKNDRRRLRSILNVETIQETIVVNVDDSGVANITSVTTVESDLVIYDHLGSSGTDD